MDFIKVNDTLLPPPVDYEINYFDVDSGETTRSETGIMHRSLVRSEIFKLNLLWKVNKADLKKICDLLKPQILFVKFSEPCSDNEKSCEMYAGEQKVKCIGFDNDESWWSLSVSLTQY